MQYVHVQIAICLLILWSFRENYAHDKLSFVRTVWWFLCYCNSREKLTGIENVSGICCIRIYDNLCRKVRVWWIFSFKKNCTFTITWTESIFRNRTRLQIQYIEDESAQKTAKVARGTQTRFPILNLNSLVVLSHAISAANS